MASSADRALQQLEIDAEVMYEATRDRFSRQGGEKKKKR